MFIAVTVTWPTLLAIFFESAQKNVKMFRNCLRVFFYKNYFYLGLMNPLKSIWFSKNHPFRNILSSKPTHWGTFGPQKPNLVSSSYSNLGLGNQYFTVYLLGFSNAQYLLWEWEVVLVPHMISIPCVLILWPSEP